MLGLCRTTDKTEMFFPSSAWGKHIWDTAIIFSWKHSLQPKQVLDFLGSRFCQNSYVDLVIALRYLAEHKFTDVTFLLVPEMGSEVPGDLKKYCETAFTKPFLGEILLNIFLSFFQVESVPTCELASSASWGLTSMPDFSSFWRQDSCPLVLAGS